MPRFVALPVIVEAYQWHGHAHELPESFRLAVMRHLVGGIVEIMTGDGTRACKHDDWIVRGPDGQFSVQRAATFETMFSEQRPAKSEKRKEAAHV